MTRGCIIHKRVAAAKLLVLNPGEFKLWKMRIEQYFLMIDYALWEVIVTGDSPRPKRTVDGVEQTYPPTNSGGKVRQEEHGLNGKRLMLMTGRDGLKWQMASVDMGEPEDFLNKSRRKIIAYGSEDHRGSKGEQEQRTCKEECDSGNTETKLCAQMDPGYDWSDELKRSKTLHLWHIHLQALQSQLNVGAYKACLESLEARLDLYKKNKVVFKKDINILKLDIKLRDNALTELRKKFEKAEKERDDLKLTLEKFGNSSKNLSKLLEIQVSDKFKTGVGFDSQVVDSQVFDSQENDRYKTSEGYHAVPPPYTGNFMPPKYDLVLADEGEYVFSESVTSIPDVTTSEAKTSVSKPKSVGEPLIEDWISDSEDENETEFKSKQRKPSFAKIEFVKSNEHVKTPRESVKKVENKKQAKYPRKNSQSPRDCDFYEKKMVEKTVWNNARRGNPQLELQEKRVIDSGCSRHMTGNKSHLSDYEEIDGGFVAFGGDPKLRLKV
ncbi:hypothetical protein Tco_1394217 [Tanacetum coccineum]